MISKGLARRPLKQGAGLAECVSQARQDHAYWLKKKNLRKGRKNMVKPTKSAPQTKSKPKPTHLNVLQANVAGLRKKENRIKETFS